MLFYLKEHRYFYASLLPQNADPGDIFRRALSRKEQRIETYRYRRNTMTTHAVAPTQDRETLPPDAQLLQLATGAFVSQAIYVAAKLGVADLLADGPRSTEYLSVATGTHEPSLYRVLRSISSIGVFTELPDGTFANSPMSESLKADHPRSTRELTIWINEEEHWRVYGHLMYSVKTGKPAFDKVYGEPIFPYLFHTNKELGEIFNRAMTSLSHQSIGPMLEAYDFSGAKVIADIAGGFGHLLGAVLAANPAAKGVLFDLPEVLAGAKEMLDGLGVTDRVTMVEGNFFENVPVEADVYILKHITHDWDDERDVRILANIGSNMKADSKLLIVDAVLSGPNEPDLGKVIDLEMLLLPGGLERTAEEFDALLRSAGFKMTRIIPTKGPMSIIEAVKA